MTLDWSNASLVLAIASNVVVITAMFVSVRIQGKHNTDAIRELGRKINNGISDRLVRVEERVSNIDSKLDSVKDYAEYAIDGVKQYVDD